MSTIKRCISLLLVLGILLSVLAPAAQAAPAEETATVDTDAMTIKGTNGFGNLLSQEITESQEEAEAADAEYPGGYTVTDLVIEGTTATVTYDTMEGATLVVALYTEDGMQMLTSATATVAPDTTEAKLTFEGEMPEYFLASAYLLDSYDLSPLCAAYDTPMYTREMQELLASTVNDYDPEKVLNLDEDETTNFAVYADSTIVIEAVEGINTVASIDDENATYVIKNADEQVTSLAEGNVFVYPYAEGEILIVKVAVIEVDGATATITGTELELEEVFAQMKIESSSETADLMVDDSTAAEGISYVGLEEDGIAPQAWEGGGSANASHTFKVDIEKKKESDHVDASFSVTGSLKVSIDVGFNYYISLKRQFIEFKATPSVTLGVNLTGNVTGKYPIGNFGVTPVAGVFIGFSPEIQLKFDGTVDLSANVSMTIGFGYSSDKGFENLTTKPKVTFNLSVEGKLFFGVDFKPNAKIIHENVASFKIGAEVGFELTAKMSGTLFEYFESDAENKHTCTACLGLDVDFKATLDGELKFLNCDWLTLKVDIAKLTFDLGSWHKSSEAEEFKKGGCKNYVYRLTVHVQDKEEESITDASVTVNEESAKTNGKGNAAFYLPEGDYTIVATDGELTKSKSIKIDEAEKVTIRLVEGTKDGSGIGGILGSVESDDLLDTTVSFNGHKYQLFNTSLTWIDAADYCEQMGGHLVTIHSQPEMNLIISLLDNAPKSYYWIGLSRDNPNSQWKWVTNEPVTYTNWAAGEPNNSDNAGETYTHLYNTELLGQWNDETNTVHGFNRSAFGFICEWDSESNYPGKSSGYQIFYDSISWTEAKTFCESLGGHLVTITSDQEQAEIEALNSTNSQLWIGGYRDDNFNWYWVTSEPWDYTNWSSGEPNNSGNERYAAVWPKYWNDLSENSGEQSGFICEWDKPEETAVSQFMSTDTQITPNALYPGDYGTEVTDTYILKTAAFRDLVPNEQYVLLAMVSVEAEDPLASDNLLFIDQAVAAEDGTLTFRYVQRTPCDISYVVACGASHKDLNDAEISFPEMVADGELQVVDPVVVYDGVTLTEGRDYVIVGSVDFTEAGEYTCYIRGIHNYTGSVECTYTVGQAENPFLDVADDSFCIDAVLWAVEKGITKGITDTRFAPDDLTTRGQIVTFLWRAAGEPEPASNANPFTDVKEEYFCYKAVLWAVENGITKGMTETIFAPNSNCTRAQAVTFLHRYMGKPAYTITGSGFTDVTDPKEFCYDAILWAVENEITGGLGDGTFGVDQTCTRGQIVTFLYRTLV